MLILVEDERIPYIEGYRRPHTPRNFTHIADMNSRFLAVDA